MHYMKNELQLFHKLAEKLLKAEESEPVVKPIDPDFLFDTIDISLSVDSASDTYFEDTLEKLVLSTPRTATRLFFNQLYGGRNAIATLGDLLAVILNNSMYTYKVAGPMVGIEKEILNQVCKIIGYGEDSGGSIAPGGSMSNFMAMVMARDAVGVSVKSEGISQKMTLYTSVESHYSIPKNAAFIGIGREQVRYVEADETGKMKPAHLEELIKEDIGNGFMPFFVNATAGTTVLGVFDDIQAISKVAKQFNLWLHIDGAYCGSVIFSKKYNHLIKGVELSDSFSFNAHKMLGTPLTCSIFVSSHKKYLYDSFSNDAAYLYQTDADDYNLGKTSIQCGRRNDSLKLWALWKSVGTNGLGKMVDQQFHLAETARKYIKGHADYTLYSFENSISVCFNYKNIPAGDLCTALYKEGKLMVGFGTFQNVQFIRLVTINAGNADADILNFFKVIEDFVAAHPTFKQPEIYGG